MSLIIGGVILWAASKAFPNIVQITDFKTLIIALILLSIVTIIIALICVGAVFVGLLVGDISSIIVGMVSILLANIIAMYIISDYLPGFNIVGFWPKVILAICFSTFQVNLSKRNN